MTRARRPSSSGSSLSPDSVLYSLRRISRSPARSHPSRAVSAESWFRNGESGSGRFFINRVGSATESSPEKLPRRLPRGTGHLPRQPVHHGTKLPLQSSRSCVHWAALRSDPSASGIGFPAIQARRRRKVDIEMQDTWGWMVVIEEDIAEMVYTLAQAGATLPEAMAAVSRRYDTAEALN